MLRTCWTNTRRFVFARHAHFSIRTNEYDERPLAAGTVETLELALDAMLPRHRVAVRVDHVTDDGSRARIANISLAPLVVALQRDGEGGDMFDVAHWTAEVQAHTQFHYQK